MLVASPTFRQRMATVPHDLSEYAREQTGPSSWSAHPDAEELAAWALEADPIYERTTDALVGVSPEHVPRVVVAVEDAAQVVSHREAFVLASIDGASTLEMMVTTVDLPIGELLETICTLCARGIVALGK